MNDFVPALPLAATMDLQYRLPPFQQILFNPTIIISLVLLVVALVIVVILSYRAKQRARQESRNEALRMAERILQKRGGDGDDWTKLKYIFTTHPSIDPAAVVMVREKFDNELRPRLMKLFGKDFTARLEKFYFPPPRDTRKSVGVGAPKDLKTLVEERKGVATSQASAAIIDLMDATLKPGIITKLTFEGLEGGHECMVMGHDISHINVTLPANNNKLIAAIRPGLLVEGSLESGPSLMAYTAEVIQAVAGSMPYCRISAWKSAWEVRKRESVRLPISVEIDFQHISTATTNNMRMSNIDKELGTIRPGKLMDISLGGCCLETPSTGKFNVGDMVRFSKSLVTGNPPATLLGAIVNVAEIDPEENAGAIKRLHVQFLIIDDVSQRILVRTMRQLQDVMAREEWMQAQQLLQRMRRNKIENLGSPAPVGGTTRIRRSTTTVNANTGTNSRIQPTRRVRSGTREKTNRQSTRGFPKIPPGGAPQ